MTNRVCSSMTPEVPLLKMSWGHWDIFLFCVLGFTFFLITFHVASFAYPCTYMHLHSNTPN